MKELTIKQKAQAYDEALERARKLHSETKFDYEKGMMEEIFPELAESEDEKIRKVICGWIYTRPISFFDNGISKEEMLAWLKKQGEMDMESYKAAEDEKREFVGDGFIKCYADFQDFKEGKTYWLEYVGNDNYNVRSDNLLGKTYHITPC